MAQTVLVVDDDPVQRRLLEAAIARSGMQVVTAPGGQPAMDLINGPRGDQITLILLDLVMPDMGGLEVLEKLRPTHPKAPIPLRISRTSDNQIRPWDTAVLLQTLLQLLINHLLQFCVSSLLEDLDGGELVCALEVEVRIFADNLVWLVLGYDLVCVSDCS